VIASHPAGRQDTHVPYGALPCLVLPVVMTLSPTWMTSLSPPFRRARGSAGKVLLVENHVATRVPVPGHRI